MPSGDEPVIVPIIRWIGRILGYLCFITAIPTVLWFFLCELLCIAVSDYLILQILLAIPRFFVLFLAIPVWLGQPVLIGFLLHIYVNNTAAIIASIAFFGVSLLGMIYSQFDHFAKAINFRGFMFKDRSGGFWWNFGQSFLDLFAVLSFIFSIASVVRIPALLVILAKLGDTTVNEDSKGFKSRTLPEPGGTLRTQVCYCALMGLLDLITLPFAIILLLVPWRMVGLKKRIEKKTHWKALDLTDNAAIRGKIMKFALNGLLDIPCFATLVFLVLTPWRFSELKLKNKSVNERRAEVLEQFGKCLLDLFFMLLGFFVVLFLFRAIPLIRAVAIKDSRIKASERRKMAAKQLGFMLYDIFVFIFSVPVLLLSVYRIPVVVRKLKKANTTWGYSFNMQSQDFTEPNAQMKVLLQALYFWRDVPFFIMAIFDFLSWRVWFTIKGLWNIDHHPDPPSLHPGNERRRLIAHQFGQLIIDIPVVFFAAIATVLFMWRAAIMWYDIVHATTTSDKRKAVFKNFLNFFVDIPFALFALIITCLLWRAPFMWHEIYVMWKRPAAGPRTVDQWDTRKCIAKHFGLLFVDLIDLPFFILSIGIILTGWRLLAFYRALKVCTNRNQRRVVVLKELGLWLLDIPTFFACFIVLLTIYRAKTMCKALGKHLSSFIKHGNNAPTTAAVPTTAPDEDNPAPASHAQEAPTRGTWHVIVWANFGLVMLDIPFPILLLLTLWRLPWCVKRLIKECESARERRILILSYLLLVVKDIPCIVLFIPMLITVWRVPSVVSMFKKLERGDNEHRLFLAIFWQWVIDTPFALMLLWTLICVWRAFFVLRTIFMQCKDAKERRKKIAQYFGMTFLDILHGILCVFNTIFFFWRTLACVRKYRSILPKYPETVFWKHSWSFYIAVRKTTGSGFVDLPFVFLGILHIAFIWRFFFFLKFILYTKWAEDCHYRRKATAKYFVICLLDIVATLGQIIVILCFWRIPTFKRKITKEFTAMRQRRQAYDQTVEEAITNNRPLPEEFQQFALTDVWYSGLFRTLVDIIVDFPFLLMGLFVILCIWRIPGYLKQMIVVVRQPVENHILSQHTTTHHSAKHDRYRRLITLWYFLNCLADIGCSILLSISFCLSLWRIPTFIVMCKYFCDGDDHFKHSIAWHLSTLYTFVISLRDTWMLFSVFVILITGGHVMCLIRHFIDFEKLKIHRDHKIIARINWRREHPIPIPPLAVANSVSPPQVPERIPQEPKPNISAESKTIWDHKTKSRIKWEEPVPIPLSPSIFFDVINYEFKHSLGFVPELFMAPLKILGLILLPIYLYINWRLNKKIKLFRRRTEAPAVPVAEELSPWQIICRKKSLSFIVFPAFFIQELAKESFSFGGIQDVLFLICFSFPLILWNELGFIPLFINHIVLLVITWFDPIWKICRMSAGYSYGNPQNIFWTIFELLYSLSLAVLVPVFFIVQLFLVVLPIIIFGSTQFPTTPGFAEFWKTFFTSVFWNTYIPSIHNWMWFISAVWWLSLLPGWHLTYKHSKYYDLFEPINVYILLVKRVLAGTIWKGYKAILSNATTWSYVHRRSCCCIGQWTVSFVFLIWSYWPFIAVVIGHAYWTGWYWLFFFSVPVSIFFTWKGYVSVKKHWKEPQRIIGIGLSDVVIRVEFPAGGGIRLIISATKHPDLVLRQAILKIEGDELWRLLASVVPGGQKILTMFRILMYPVKLCPNFLNPAEFVTGRNTVNTVIQFGTEGKWKIKKKLILRYAKRIVDNGDPEFRLVVEFGDKTFRWVKYGELCSVTTRLSTVLNCVELNRPLPIGADGKITEYQNPTQQVEIDSKKPATSTNSNTNLRPGQIQMEVNTQQLRASPPPPPPPPPPLPLPPRENRTVFITHENDPVITTQSTITVATMREKYPQILETATTLAIPIPIACGALFVMEQQGRTINQDSFIDVATGGQLSDEITAASFVFQNDQ